MEDIALMSREALVAELMACADTHQISDTVPCCAMNSSTNGDGFQIAAVSRKLLVAKEVISRDLLASMKREPSFDSPARARDWLRLHFAGMERVVFVVMFLDRGNRLITVEEMFLGSISESRVYPREILKATLKHNAASLIAAHNYPSGRSEPSDADRRLTRDLVSALDLIDVKLLDHFVVAGMDTVSFAERGWI
jgi:DNA repair protein RadC